jgi:hypothetical protein
MVLLRLEVTHRADHRESITWVGHVQVSDENIEIACSDKSYSFRHIGGSNHCKSPSFKSGLHHFANGFVVVHEQNLVSDRGF